MSPPDDDFLDPLDFVTDTSSFRIARNMSWWRRIRQVDREQVSETAWRWRWKILPQKSSLPEKPLSLDSTEDDNAKGPVSGKDPAFGAEIQIKTLFEGKHSDSDRFDWVDYPPKQISKAASRAQDRVAIRVFKIKDRDKPCIQGRYPLKFHKIDIQNSLLVTALEPILQKENVKLDTNETAMFLFPFRPLWFCQEEIHNLWRSKAEDEPIKPYLELLLRLLDEVFADMRVKRRHLKASGLVDFRTAWTLFPRGSTIYSEGLNSEFLAKVDTTSYVCEGDKTWLVLKCKVLSFSGELFLWKSKKLAIGQYEGNKLVRDLDHFPLEFHPDASAIERRVAARGKKVLDLQGLEYRCYNALALHKSAEKDCIEKHNVEGRVLIDVVGYNKFHLAMGSREDNSDKDRVRRARRNGANEPQDNDDTEGLKPLQRRLNEKEKEENRVDMMAREEDFKFMSELIGGYSLKSKLWVQFYVEDIEPMTWNDGAYSHLVYDDQQKDLVLSFVESHNLKNPTSTAVVNASQPMQDVIIGKGQGLIILLSGPPGTGKTLTAEAVADKTHRPLLYLHAEDLGINAATLGANVKRMFEMATDWDAVILLDEADVFMAERHPTDIHRNELVSIFLRELEYFRGIIFLTTNLYHTIDTAFRSRVSLHLLFQALSAPARETVWRKFLDRLPQQQLSSLQSKAVLEIESGKEAAEPEAGARPLDDEDIKELSLWQLNGREIKNAVKMVRAWCDHKGYAMTLDRLESGIRVTNPHANKDGNVDESLYD
ncbi:ATPase family associated with various cellular activities (AAA) domain-containing protein [Sarocladium implicatum]|nr:ATPase family associated with various cellular activities (AAA) domain-containing protein [Sarocladium implicatum]